MKNSKKKTLVDVKKMTFASIITNFDNIQTIANISGIKEKRKNY